jgi:curved DNA-binding protein CbpA
MNYFRNVQNLNEAKNLFRKLSIQLHPDTSGYDSQADFVEMYREFQTLTNKLKFDTGFEADKNFNAEKFYNIIKKFEKLTDIQISFVGSFIWLEDIKPGAMYRQKTAIKDIKIEGYNSARWASQKKNWYFSPEDYKQKGKSSKSLEEIKNRYGSHEYKTKEIYNLN